MHEFLKKKINLKLPDPKDLNWKLETERKLKTKR